MKWIDDTPHKLSKRLKCILMILFTLAFFMRNQILMKASTYSPHDAGLFFRTVRNLLEGLWLGPFDNLTLAKGPLLSLLAAFAHLLGFPYKPLEFFLYLCICLWFALFINRCTRSEWLAIGLFFALAFNPVSWSSYNMIFMREPLYMITSLAVFVACAWAFWGERTNRKTVWFGMALGLSFAMFWLTREEGIWLYPALALMVGFAILLPRSGESFFLSCIANGKHLAKVMSVAVLFGSITIGTVAAINYQHYGRFITCEFRSPEFLHAYSALARIKSSINERFYPVSSEAIKLAFSVSNTAAKLEPEFRRATDLHRQSLSSDNTSPENETEEREFNGAIFMWALRHAAQRVGVYSDARNATGFFQRMGDEINAACDDHRLRCNEKRETFAPPLPWEHAGDFAKSFALAMWKIVSLAYDSELKPLESIHGLGRLGEWEELLGQIAPSQQILDEERRMIVHGWIASPDFPPNLGLQIPDLGNKIFQLTLFEAPALDRMFAKKKQEQMVARHFTLSTNCLEQDCTLEAISGKTALGRVSMSKIPNIGFVEFSENFKMFVLGKKEILSLYNPLVSRPYLEQGKLWIMNHFGMVYNFVFCLFAGLATLGVLIHLLWKNRLPHCTIPWCLACVAIAAMLTRAAIIAYIDTESWTAVTVNYLMPAYGFSVLYSVLGTFLFVSYSRNYFNSTFRFAKKNQQIAID
jgi:hypothetical protein